MPGPDTKQSVEEPLNEENPLSEPEIEEDKGAEVGQTEAGLSANAALRAMAQAARSFLLYDTNNRAILRSLENYREAIWAALAYGTLNLTVRPFEMVRDGEVVYLERDRERSLAFRLYRDGVRRVEIDVSVEWDELLKLLQILSIRYTGVGMQEDDVVTLLWKAGFQCIEVVAVEGFVLDEGEEEANNEVLQELQAKTGMTAIEAPHDFDLPMPRILEPMPLRYRAVKPQALKALHAETSSLALPTLAIRLVSILLSLVHSKTDPTELSEALPLIDDVRRFLQSEGQLGQLLDLLRLLQPTLQEHPKEMGPIVVQFADKNSMQNILHSVGRDAKEVPTELAELMDLVPADHVQNILAVLHLERGAASRRVMRKIIAQFAEERLATFQEFLLEGDPMVAADVLRALAGAIPDRALEFALSVQDRDSKDIQAQIGTIVENMTTEIPLDVLLGMLDSPSQTTRMAILARIIEAASKEAFAPVSEYFLELVRSGAEDDECEAVGQALVASDIDAAGPLLISWIRPGGFFGRMIEMPGQKYLHWAAVTGLSQVPGKKADKVIKWLSKRAGGKVHAHCMRALVKRRRSGLSDG